MFVPPLMTLLRGPQPIALNKSLSGPSGNCAAYFASVGKTILTWYTVGVSGYKSACVAAYDHATDTWSEAYTVGNFLLADDAHGQTSICQDADGFFYVFFGSHASPQHWSISNVANDITGWTQQTALTGAQTYPHAILVGSVIYLLLRNDAVLSRRPLALRTATPASGSATFSAMSSLVDFGANSRFYISECHVVGTDIHFAATRPNDIDTSRRGVYYFVYKTATGALTNHDGSFSVASGSLPMSLSDANTNCRLFDHGSGEGDTPSLVFDSAGDPHVVFIDNGGSGSTYTIKHIKRTSGTWSSPANVDSPIFIEYPGAGYKTVYKTNQGAAAGSIEIWYVKDSTGHKMRAIRDSGGVFSAGEALVTTVGPELLVSHERVRNGLPEFRAVFSQATGSLTTPGDAGAFPLKFYGWGDAGPLLPKIPQDTIDPLFANVSLLLGCEHRDGAITLVNDAPQSILMASRNGQAQIDTAQFKFGSASMLLDGTGDFFTYPHSGNFSVANGDITVEAFIRRNGASKQQVIVGKRGALSEWVLYVLADNRVLVGAFNAGGAVVSLPSVATISTGVWYHVEFDRVGTTWYLFVDGNLEGSVVESASPATNGTALFIGRDSTTTARDWNGWIDEVRITSGAARHTATFTPPAAAHPRR